MQTLNTVNSVFSTILPINFKRGSIETYDDATSSIIGTNKAYNEVFQFINDFNKQMKSRQEDINKTQLIDTAKELNSILIENDICPKHLYDRLFLARFSSFGQKFSAKHHNLSKIMVTSLGVVCTPYMLVYSPIVFTAFAVGYCDKTNILHRKFKSSFENLKNQCFFTPKMIMYLMALIRCIVSEGSEVNEIFLLMNKSPYGDLFDYIEDKKLYSGFSDFMKNEVETKKQLITTYDRNDFMSKITSKEDECKNEMVKEFY